MTTYNQSDMTKLNFLVGRWSGQGPDGKTFYEEYDFSEPTVFRSRRFPDSRFLEATDGSTVELRGNQIISTWGEFTWEATTVTNGFVEFRPVNAPSSFSWRETGPETVEVVQNWTDENGEAQHYTIALTRER